MEKLVEKARELGVGIHSQTEIERKVAASMGGKAAQKTLKEKKISAFYDPLLRFMISSKGGKVGAFTMSNIQSELGKRGGVKNKGFKWYNNGTNSFKYTLKMQEVLPFSLFWNRI